MTRRDAVIAGLLVAGLLACLLPLAPLGVDPHHDGIMLKPALDVLSGQVLFRDTFTQYGALTTYLQVLALRIQPTLLALRIATVLAYAVTLFFLYGTWRMILPRSLATLSCGLFILFIPGYEKDWLGHYWLILPWSSAFALMFQVIGLHAMFRIIRHEQAERWGLLLGLACACVLWCRMPVGILMTASVAAVGLGLHWTGWTPAGLSQRKVVVATIGGFVTVHALLLGGVLLAGAGAEWWYQNFVWPSQWMGTVPLDWQKFITAFVHPAATAWLVVLLLAAALPRLLRRFKPDLPASFTTIYYVGLGAVLLWQQDRLLPALALRQGGWTALFPLVVLGQTVASLVPAFTQRDRAAAKPMEYYLVAALAAVALGSLPQYYPLPDPWHMLWSLGPGFGLGVYVFWRWLMWPAPIVALVVAAAFLPATYAKVRAVSDALGEPRVTLTAPAVLRGMKVPPAQARSIGQIMNTLEPILRHDPNLPSALIGVDAMVLTFMNNLANPLPYYVNWPNLTDGEGTRRRWRYIEIVRPLIFFQRANWSAVGEFYRDAHYVPLAYVPDEALEIAVPQELADAMGLKAYGANPERAQARGATKP